MKNILCSGLAFGIFVLELMYGSGCTPALPEGLPDSDRFVYDVQSELEPAFEYAAARIEKASGVVLLNVPNGTPINLFDESPQGSCADTYVTGWFDRKVVTSVNIDMYPPPDGCYTNMGDTLTHELIHSLRRYLDLGTEMGHSEHGVFTAQAGDPRLDETSLEKICEAVDCAWFTPEAE